MSVAQRFPEQRVALESLAHARIARDLLRKKLSEHELFKDSDPGMIKAILTRFEPYEFYGGETLYVEGEPADALLFVGMGQLQVTEKVAGASKRHDRVITRILEAGDFADAVPFMMEKPRYDVCKVRAQRLRFGEWDKGGTGKSEGRGRAKAGFWVGQQPARSLASSPFVGRLPHPSYCTSISSAIASQYSHSSSFTLPFTPPHPPTPPPDP